MIDVRGIRDDLTREWTRIGPFAVCELLGLRFRKESRQAVVRCPWVEERTPSCWIGIGPQGSIRVHCFGCGETRDVHALFAQVRGFEVTGSGFRNVLVHEAETLGRWDLVEALDAKGPFPATDAASCPIPASAPPRPESEREYLDRDGLLKFIGSCVCTDQVETVARHVRCRGLEPREVDVRGLAFGIPRSCLQLPRWARFRGQSWVETGHLLVLPVYNACGNVVGVRACRVVDGDSPKRLPPAGHKTGGLVMADAMGVEVLRAGRWPEWARSEPRVVIAEGEFDFLTWAVRTPLRCPPSHAVLGIYSGAWCPEVAARIPSGTRVAIWTDADPAGERYAAHIALTLGSRCLLIRGGIFG